MRLRFSRTADYGLRAALEVAREPAGRLVTRHAIARAIDAPASVVAQSLAGLVRAGILVAQAGPRGGYRLASDPKDVSVYEIVQAIDGEALPERCVLHDGVCSWDGACPFHAVLAGAQQAFLQRLRDASLADVLAAFPPAVEPGTAQ